MHVKIADWAWFSLSEFPASKLSMLKRELTVKPRRTSVHQKVDPEPIKLYRESRGHIGVPRSFFTQQVALSGRKHHIDDQTSVGRELDIKFNGELKEDQKRGMAKVIEDRDSGSYGGIIQAAPGWGKTVAALGVWSAFNTTAVVLVQKEFLLNQWVKRIEQFMPDACIGIIQKDKCEYGEDFDITVAMLQTLSRRMAEYPDDMWSSFGLLISDECHRVSAPSWVSIAPNFRARYRLGLSATPRRKDGTEDVFLLHLGNIIYRSRARRVVPRLRRIFTSFKPTKTRTFDLDRMSREIQLRHICKSPVRNDLIISEALKAIGAGRKIMVLSERRNHLEILKEKFDGLKMEKITSDFYVGGMKQSALDEAEKADILFCTYQMTKEALDIPALDTVFLTTPVGDVEQAVGRIMREYEGKKNPIITDFIDEHVSRFAQAWNTRKRFYIKEGMFKDK